MCELVIQVTEADPHPLQRMVNQRGDVVECMPDGWGWTPHELTNPKWRIVRLPGVSTGAITDMMQPVLDRDGIMIARRSRKIDLESIPTIEQLMVKGQVLEVTGTRASTFLGARVDRASDQAVIG